MASMSCSKQPDVGDGQSPSGESGTTESASVTTGALPREKYPDRIDTTITPDMVQDLQWGSGSGDETAPMQTEVSSVFNSKEKPGVSISPKLIIKDEKDVLIKDDYLEYIDGAGIEVNIKLK